MTDWQAVIFDMDGLLVDSETVWHIAETELIESRGHRYTPDVRAQIVGMRMDQFLIRLHEVYNFQDNIDVLYQELTERMLTLIPQRVKPQPGAQALVEYVAERRMTVAIASSSPMSIIDAVLASCGWQDVFAVRCSADDDEHGKPAPDVYLRTARVLGVRPSGCLALEDSPNGARAATAAGMTCYAVPDLSHTKVSAFEGITPYIFDSLHTVLMHLKDPLV